MLRKITAVLLCAAVSAGAATAAFAEEPEQVYTESVVRELGASAVSWNGKTALLEGKNYAVTKDISINSSVIIPEDTVLTVRKGAKLTIGKNGELIDAGTLSIAKGAKLSVSGRLIIDGECRGIDSEGIGNLKERGEIAFGKAADVRLFGGKTTVYSTGVISGKPQTLYIDKDAAVSIKGKDANKAFSQPLKERSLRAKLSNFFAKAMGDKSTYSAITYMYPASYITFADERLREAGTDLKTFCEEYDKQIAAEEYFPYGDKSFDWRFSISALTAAKALTSEETVTAEAICGSGSYKAYIVEGTVSAVCGCEVYDEPITVKVIYSRGKWYLLGVI